MYPNHEKDVYGWAVHTAQLLREKKMSEVDFNGIIEEIEALGRSEKHELVNVILSHHPPSQVAVPAHHERA